VFNGRYEKYISQVDAVNINAIALSGLSSATLRLASSANNIANATTTGIEVSGKRVGSYTPTDVVQTAVEPQGGVSSALVARDPSAVNASSAGVNDPASRDNTPQFPNVDLAEEVVNTDIATYDFKANLKSLKAANDALGTLLNIAV
jgi:flagellar basal body rod protein FlgC